MAQPTPYNRQYSFTSFQTVSPSDPLPADKHELEYNAIKITLDQILSNLALIQRDDGALANDSVGFDQLKAEVVLGFNAPSTWTVAPTNYVVGDTVFFDNRFYRCIVAHVSTASFAADLANGYWELIADFTSVASNASAISVTDAGGYFSGTDVEAVLQEIGADIAGLGGGSGFDINALSADTIALADTIPFYDVGGADQNKTTLQNFWNSTALLAALTSFEAADAVPIYDDSASAMKKATLANLFGAISTLSSEASPATGDEILLYDASETAANRMTLTNLLKVITSLNAETTPAVADEFVLYSAAGSAPVKATIANMFKAINGLTVQSSPTHGSDYVAVYDAGAASARKVLLNKIGLVGGGTALADVAFQGEVQVDAEVQTPRQTLTSSTGIALNLAGASKKYVELDHNTTITVSGAIADQTVIVWIKQGTTGGTATWSGIDAWRGGSEPTLSTVTGAFDKILIETLDDATVHAEHLGVWS